MTCLMSWCCPPSGVQVILMWQIPHLRLRWPQRSHGPSPPSATRTIAEVREGCGGEKQEVAGPCSAYLAIAGSHGPWLHMHRDIRAINQSDG